VKFLNYPAAHKLQIIDAYTVALPNAYVHRHTAKLQFTLIKHTALISN